MEPFQRRLASACRDRTAASESVGAAQAWRGSVPVWEHRTDEPEERQEGAEDAQHDAAFLEGHEAYGEHADEVDQRKGGNQDLIETRHELSRIVASELEGTWARPNATLSSGRN